MSVAIPARVVSLPLPVPYKKRFIHRSSGSEAFTTEENDKFAKFMDRVPIPSVMRSSEDENGQRRYAHQFANTQLDASGKPSTVVDSAASIIRRRLAAGALSKFLYVHAADERGYSREQKVVMIPLAPIPAILLEQAAAQQAAERAEQARKKLAEEAKTKAEREFWQTHCQVKSAGELLTCGTETQQDFLKWCASKNVEPTKRMAKKYLQLKPHLHYADDPPLDE